MRLHEACVNDDTVQCMLSQVQKYALSFLAKMFDHRLLRAKPSEIIWVIIINYYDYMIIIYGQRNAPDIYFNGQRIEAVQSYKYLGNLISTISSAKGDILRENYSY